ncbi:hypothetical protein F4779DRAFT_587676 [Xylariaceae sp. FL0662B]|nr:hypothetical protein F4779DRAFT_587676 [Xylariaceae sp. FL0662B]
MSPPSTNANGQSSILNFFQPKQPSYAPPPSPSRITQVTPLKQPPPPPPSAATATATATARPPPAATDLPSPPPLEPAPPPTRPPGLHPQASISPVLPEHVKPLRSIIGVLLQVHYGDQFFARLFDPLSSGAFSRVLLWSEGPDAPAKVIGGLVCRPEPESFEPTKPASSPSTARTPDSQPNVLYIQTLVLLSPYQRLGLAAALLEEVMRAAARSAFRCASVYAHVWTENPDGLRWYLARGFAKTDEVHGYYRQLQPDSAWIVRRPIHGVSAALGLPTTTAAATATPESQNRQTTISTTTTIPPSVTAEAANLPAINTTTTAPPPPTGGAAAGRPSPSPLPLRSPGQSFQNARPETEWNDLPADMHSPRGALGVPPPSGSGASSTASSRSSSVARRKKDRAYPAAAFGPK